MGLLKNILSSANEMHIYPGKAIYDECINLLSRFALYEYDGIVMVLSCTLGGLKSNILHSRIKGGSTQIHMEMKLFFIKDGSTQLLVKQSCHQEC